MPLPRRGSAQHASTRISAQFGVRLITLPFIRAFLAQRSCVRPDLDLNFVAIAHLLLKVYDSCNSLPVIILKYVLNNSTQGRIQDFGLGGALPGSLWTDVSQGSLGAEPR